MTCYSSIKVNYLTHCIE